MERQNRFWELLGRKAADEINDSDARKLDDLQKDQDHDVQYMMNVMGSYWNSVNNMPDSKTLREGADQHKKSVLEGLTSRDQLHRRTFREFMSGKNAWILAAASVIVILGGWFLFQTYRCSGADTTVVATKSGSRTKVTLPDGTQVWLNVDSKLTYPNNFPYIAKREVTLSGEAYFEVKHDESHPFIIHTQYFNIEDVGTAFNVKAYPEDSETEATLVSGSIAVSLRNDPGKNLLLKPGEKVLYYASDIDMKVEGGKSLDTIQAADKIRSLRFTPTLEVTHVKPIIVSAGDTVVTETAWMNDQLVFSSQKFSELGIRLSRWYNVHVTIKDKEVENYLFTGIFQGETIEQALKELQMIRPFSFSIENDNVVIDKPHS